MGVKRTDEVYICGQCGHIGHGEIRLRGSAAVERFMWFALLFPGPLYSYWRRTGREILCGGCHSSGQIVPVDSKLGAVMLENKLRGIKGVPTKPPEDTGYNF